MTEAMEAFWAKRWAALTYAALLGVVFSANYTNHGPLVPTLVKTWGISLSVAGLLTTAIFTTHGLLQIPGGALADRFGAKNIGTIGLAIITVTDLWAASAGSIGWLLAAKFFCGIGTGLAFIGGLRYVPTFFQGKEIQHAQGVYGGSILLGSGFVIYGVPQILHAVGWRAVFLTTGGMAAALLVVWVALAPATPANVHHVRARWGEVLGSRNLWILAFAQLASFGTIVSAGVWVNVVLTRNVGVPAKTAGVIGSLILLLGIVFRPLGGMLVQRAISPKRLIVLSAVGLAVAFWLVGRSTTVPFALASIVLAGLMSGLPFAPIFNYARESVPRSPGVAMGLVNTAGALAVMAFPPIIGRIVDATGSFTSGFLLLAGVSLAAGVVSTALAPTEAATAPAAAPAIGLAPRA